MKLVIGNKNYSSWSLRPWLLLRQTGIAFEEIKLSFNSPTFKRDALAFSPTGKVPVLIDGDLTVWDSLAIAEYLAEKFPERELWPRDARARAQARAICAEMHAGFQALRAQMSMNVSANLAGLGWNVAVQADIDRISAIWSGLRARHRGEGPFLFGRFSIADAYYAPVVARFNTYKPKLAPALDEYMNTMLQLPAMQDWFAAAAQENDFVVADEPYRVAPDAGVAAPPA
ncbi:MAG: glutathione S-transferase family protein [Burkholderiaceae bacterium]|nr:glutathione S-transferase family protein [Burkholderiaceae bacterium]